MEIPAPLLKRIQEQDRRGAEAYAHRDDLIAAAMELLGVSVGGFTIDISAGTVTPKEQSNGQEEGQEG